MSIFNGIIYWANSLNENDVQIWIAIIQTVGTIIAAFLATIIVFIQLRKQFENKVIYDGWKDFQKKLFKFSSAFTDFSTRIQWLNYVIDSQDNLLVNKGNKAQYRTDKWQELSNSHIKFQKANTAFLRSFETHEMVFLELRKMKSLFQYEVRLKVNDPYVNFEEIIFPEMYGTKSNIQDKEIKDRINQFSEDVVNTGVLLEDFRTELQNVSIGKVLNRTIPKREPDKGYRILTKSGFITQKKQLKREIEDL